ncbi:transposase [Nitrosospira multiformis]|nr:transposase [Nitrosospira multiformis]
MQSEKLSKKNGRMSSVGNKTFQDQGRPRDEEMGTLGRELIQVRKERDFLKEAAAFFTKASK